MLRVLVCLFMAGGRLLELAWSRRNMRSWDVLREGKWSRRTYGAVVLVHTVAIVATAVFGRRNPTKSILLILAAAQVMRAWILVSLGRRWNTRAAVPDQLTIQTRGPYRWIRHPNYAVVMVELATLPAAFGLYRLAYVVSLANAVLLAIRIHDEERLLAANPVWRVHFERRKRFVPRVL